MHEHVTFLRPQAQSPDARGITSVFPPEVFEQVRGRDDAFQVAPTGSSTSSLSAPDVIKAKSGEPETPFMNSPAPRLDFR